MRVSLIVAVAENGVIGRDDGLPWRLSSDLKRFKQTTMGHPMIMGRKTYESIGRPLPGRTSIIVTRDASYQADGCLVANSVEAAIRQAGEIEFDKALDAEVFVIGGRQIYELTLPLADRLYWTTVCANPDGDTFFPAIIWDDWQLQEEEAIDTDEQNQFKTIYRIFDRTADDALARRTSQQ